MAELRRNIPRAAKKLAIIAIPCVFENTYSL